MTGSGGCATYKFTIYKIFAFNKNFKMTRELNVRATEATIT